MTTPPVPQDQGRAVWPWIVGLIILLIIIFWIWRAHDNNVAASMMTDSALAPVTPAAPAPGTGVYGTPAGTTMAPTGTGQSNTP